MGNLKGGVQRAGVDRDHGRDSRLGPDREQDDDPDILHQQHRERIWASPACLNPDPEPTPQQALF